MKKVKGQLTDAGIDRFILANAFLSEMYGMIVANRKAELNGCASPYDEPSFGYIADKMRDVVREKNNDNNK